MINVSQREHSPGPSAHMFSVIKKTQRTLSLEQTWKNFPLSTVGVPSLPQIWDMGQGRVQIVHVYGWV